MADGIAERKSNATESISMASGGRSFVRDVNTQEPVLLVKLLEIEVPDDIKRY